MKRFSILLFTLLVLTPLYAKVATSLPSKEGRGKGPSIVLYCSQGFQGPELWDRHEAKRKARTVTVKVD